MSKKRSFEENMVRDKATYPCKDETPRSCGWSIKPEYICVYPDCWHGMQIKAFVERTSNGSHGEKNEV